GSGWAAGRFSTGCSVGSTPTGSPSARRSSRRPGRSTRWPRSLTGALARCSMRPLSDTSPEAQRVLSAAYGAMGSERKLRLIEQELRLVRSLHEARVRRRNPDATRSEIRDSWNAMVLGPDLWKAIKGDAGMDQELEPLSVLRQVVGVFEKLGLAYAIGGSWAS